VRSIAKGSALGLCWGLLVAVTGGIAAGPARAAELPLATDARLGGDDARTRFVLDLTKPIEVAAFTLPDPYRVVLDLPQIIFQLPAKTGETGRGLVKAFRFGLVMPGGSRIVLDTGAPVRIEKAFVIDPVDSQPARLVLDLVAIDRESFLRNIAVDSRPRRPAPPKPDRDAKDADPRPLVVLDPGHGGLDSGTVAPTGDTEKTIVLDFAQQLRDKLEKTGKYRVAMTRTDDRFVPLADRVQLARSRQAALFLSIHADALPRRDSESRGASIYTLSETASDAEAGRLAEAENRADVIAGVDLSAEPDDVADILIDLAQRETKTFSANFAHALIRELKATSRLHKHPLKSAGFRVLKAPDVPSVLVELGYVSSSQDLKYLMSDAWRSRATDSIVQAVATFFATRLAGGAAGGSH
jgi:N-acetylmuramoyl-L-alanine amidase